MMMSNWWMCLVCAKFHTADHNKKEWNQMALNYAQHICLQYHTSFHWRESFHSSMTSACFFWTEISPDKRSREPTTIEAMIKPCDDTNYCCLESHACFHWKASLRIASLSFPKNYAREIP
jgi:hypothetical protein